MFFENYKKIRTFNGFKNFVLLLNATAAALKTNFSIKDFFSKCDQIRSFCLCFWNAASYETYSLHFSEYSSLLGLFDEKFRKTHWKTLWPEPLFDKFASCTGAFFQPFSNNDVCWMRDRGIFFWRGESGGEVGRQVQIVSFLHTVMKILVRILFYLKTSRSMKISKYFTCDNNWNIFNSNNDLNKNSRSWDKRLKIANKKCEGKLKCLTWRFRFLLIAASAAAIVCIFCWRFNSNL